MNTNNEATRPSVDLSGLTRYSPSVVSGGVAAMMDNSRGSYVKFEDVQALATKAKPAPQPTTSVPRAASIDTPYWRAELRRMLNCVVARGFVADDDLDLIIAHIARQAQAVPDWGIINASIAKEFGGDQVGAIKAQNAFKALSTPTLDSAPQAELRYRLCGVLHELKVREEYPVLQGLILDALTAPSSPDASAQQADFERDVHANTYAHMLELAKQHGFESVAAAIRASASAQAAPADVKDAERYRWLRSAENKESASYVSVYGGVILDEAIDAAMATNTPAGDSQPAVGGAADELGFEAELLKKITDAYSAKFSVPSGYGCNEVVEEVVRLIADSACEQPGGGLATVHAFLLGEGPLDGVWFGDLHPMHLSAKYWWRNNLREAIAATQPKE